MEENILDKLDMRKLGRELQLARTKRGLTQADAAQILDVARTTITAIEKGERRLKADELIKLARAYGRQVTDFVRQRPQIEPFQVQFRGPYLRDEDEDSEISKYIDQLEEFSRDYLELEQITNSPLVKKYPNEYTIDGIRVDLAAEDVANQERKRLGLGDGPIPILRDILEQDVGLRIFYLPIKPSKYSAMYLYDHELGGCIGINLLHPEERRRWSLAHDYGHFLAHRYKPTMFVINNYQRVPQSEQFADYFAACFLMPNSGLTMRFNDLRKTKEKIVVADLCMLANFYGVSVEALTLRLEDLKLIPTGIWDKLQQGGFKVREAQAQLGLGEIPSQDSQLPIRYQNLAVLAFEQGLITEGQFSHYLRTDRLSARSIAENLRRQRSQTSGINSEIDLDLTESINI
ncbi:MAG: XRE family transcriptional regulator [Anaerolineales bacterium]|nr:XRE family transcriptional regulator [Anaerolineales bacterium]